jgi:hypothetical protein
VDSVLLEIDELRSQLQRRHREHVEVELRLGFTLAGMATTERQLGETANADKSIQHAQDAVRGAQQGLLRITNFQPGESQEYLARIAELERTIEWTIAEQ